MTDDKIEPALTPEQWATEMAHRESWPKNDPDYGPPRASEWPLDDYSRHALAALCLYQQPFGFSREDGQWVNLGWKLQGGLVVTR